MNKGDVFFLPAWQEDKWITSVKLLREMRRGEWECVYVTPNEMRGDLLTLSERFLARRCITAYIARQS
jgi:hypothetical protein